METKALLVLDTWSTSTEFKTDLINTMKSNGLNIITDLEATDIVLAVNYMTSLIYSYYKNYYLSNASKERTLELMSITASGKLNFYASELKAYKDAYTHDFKSLGGNENSSTHDTSLNRSGKSKQATTPETIAKGSDYIDDYSSSEQKYENANTEKGTRSFNSTIKGSEQDYWKNIISIPKRLYEDIIGSFSKFFFSSSMELTPCAVLTIEQAIQKLKDEIKSSNTTTKTEINSLKSLIKINQEEIKDLKTSVNTLVTAGENTDNRVTTLDKQIGDIQRKIDKTNTNLENLTKVTPTDVAIKDKKLGLKHDTTWLTNQDAITLGDNLTYDDTTRTLNAKVGDYTAIHEDDHADYVKILLKKNNVEEYYGGYVPKSLNTTATPKVLRSVNNSMSWVDLPKYYEHDGIITVGDNYVMIKYISTDSTKINDLNQVIIKLMGNYITASGSFMLDSGQVAMVYGMDFGQNTTLFNCSILDLNIQAIVSSDISLGDVEIRGYSENVRLIE